MRAVLLVCVVVSTCGVAVWAEPVGAPSPCSQPFYEPNGFFCNPNLPNDRCGPNSVCEPTHMRGGMCCQIREDAYTCPAGRTPTGDTCDPAQLDSICGYRSICKATPDGGICCQEPPQITPESCGANGMPNGITCTPGSGVNECGLANCVATYNLGNIAGICCEPQLCSGNNVPTGARCSPGINDYVCGAGARCEAPAAGGGICCQIRPVSSPMCRGNALPTGMFCTYGLPDQCGYGATCQRNFFGQDICCRSSVDTFPVVNSMV